MSSVSINTIPDEILKKILAYALIIPDDDFTSIDHPSPFAHILVSSSDILLIDKRCLRIATPLLYECIVLRTTPQAQAFYNTLRGKSGPQLKRFVRRVRLEASFGAFTDRIFTALPEIKDLFLQFPNNADEIVTGLAKGLQKLSPTRVILEFPSNSPWKNSDMTNEALCKALRTWKTLNTIKLSVFSFYRYCDEHEYGEHDRERLTSFVEALSMAPNLQLVILSISREGGLSLAVETVKKIGSNNSLQSILLFLPSQNMLKQIQEGLIGDSCANIVQCSLSLASSTDMTLYDRNDAMQVPQLPDEIIEIILDIYLQSSLSHNSIETTTSQAKYYRRRCIDLMVVSKRFYIISRSMLFRYVGTRLPSGLSIVLKMLSKATTAHASSVETVTLPSIPSIPSVDILPEDENRRQATKIIDLLSRLPRVSKISISYQNIDILERMPINFKLGLRLLELRASNGGLFHRSALAQFSNLTGLSFAWDDKAEAPPVRKGRIDRICLPNVKFIKIKDYNYVILRLIEACDFPSAQFLRLNLQGSPYSISSEPLILPALEKLQSIELHGRASGIYVQLLQAERDTVEKIFISFKEYMRDKDRRNINSFIVNLFETIDFSKFRGLKELQLGSVTRWPYQENMNDYYSQEMKNSTWQNHARMLTSTYGFVITDASGIPWKPRLQKRTKAKN